MRGGAKPGRRGRLGEDALAAAFRDLPGSTVTRISPPVRIVRPMTKTGRGGLRTFEGYFESLGVCDFEGGYRGIHVAVDAKRWQVSSSPRWNFKASIAAHQMDRLQAVSEAGGIAAILLLVDIDQNLAPSWFGIPWWEIRSARSNGEKSFHVGALLEADASPLSGILKIETTAGLRPKLEPFFYMMRGLVRAPAI